MELLLIRHALPVRQETDGGPADPELSELGWTQAAALARHWSDGVDAVWTSPLRRARETARPLLEGLGLEPTVDEDLAELDREAAAYIPIEELRGDPVLWAEAVAAWTGAEGEALRARFRSQVAGAIDRVVEAHAGQRVAVVCHGGVINAAVAEVIGLGPSLFFEPSYVSVSRVVADRRGNRQLMSLNETWHVDRPAVTAEYN